VRKRRTVAILLFDGVEVLDFSGPAEVFIVAAEGKAFRVITVAEHVKPVHTMGGLRVLPDFDIATAPRADIVVVPGGAMEKVSRKGLAWIRTVAAGAEVVMSVCMGAFLLARAGLLDGVAATTHHWGLKRLKSAAPLCRVVRGERFVDGGHVVTTAGVTAGIDGALHIVERLLGRAARRWTARSWMEHEGQSRNW
jgi:transcriptional regulator GlxA family with amidase domain